MKETTTLEGKVEGVPEVSSRVSRIPFKITSVTVDCEDGGIKQRLELLIQKPLEVKYYGSLAVEKGDRLRLYESLVEGYTLIPKRIDVLNAEGGIRISYLDGSADVS